MTWSEAFHTHPGEMALWTLIMGGVALGFVLSAVSALVSIFRGRPYPRYDYRHDYHRHYRRLRHYRRPRWERRLPRRDGGTQVPIHAFYRGGGNGPGVAA